MAPSIKTRHQQALLQHTCESPVPIVSAKVHIGAKLNTSNEAELAVALCT